MVDGIAPRVALCRLAVRASQCNNVWEDDGEHIGCDTPHNTWLPGGLPLKIKARRKILAFVNAWCVYLAYCDSRRAHKPKRAEPIFVEQTEYFRPPLGHLHDVYRRHRIEQIQ
jgi:hypothetical protein